MSQALAIFLGTIVGLMVGIPLGVATIDQMKFNEAEATGCPVDTIIPFIDDAIKSFNSGDYATALSQMQEAKTQLEDTFEVDEDK